jgi:hypothetical protein
VRPTWVGSRQHIVLTSTPPAAQVVRLAYAGTVLRADSMKRQHRLLNLREVVQKVRAGVLGYWPLHRPGVTASAAWAVA